MGKLSKSFRRSEFACPCCGKARIKKRLVRALQLQHDYIEGALKRVIRIIVNSGYRCKEHNAKIGGVSNSQHVKGTAADCAFPDCLLFEAWLAAEQLPEFVNGGIGVYPPYRECLDENCKLRFDEKDEDNLCPLCGHKSRRRGNFLHLDVRGKRARWGKYMDKKIPYQDAVGMLEKGDKA